MIQDRGAFSQEHQALAQPRAGVEVGKSLLAGSSFWWQSKLGEGHGDHEFAACHITELFCSLLTERQRLYELGARKVTPDPW